MSYEIANLRRIRIAEEASANFGLDKSGTLTFYDVPFKEGSGKLSVSESMLAPAVTQQYIDEIDQAVVGPRSAKLSLTLPLAPTGIIANATTASAAKTDAAILMMLHLGFGASVSGSMGSTVATGTSSTVFDVAAGHGSRFTAGGACALPTGTAGAYELREIASVSTDTITLKRALSATPSASDVVLNATTIYGDDDPTSGYQMTVQGREADEQFVLAGGQLAGPPKLTTKLGEIPEVQFDLEFANWWQVSSLSTFAEATYSNFNPGYVFGEFAARVLGASTASVIDPSAYDFGLAAPKWGKVMSPGGVNTFLRWRRARVAPMAKPTFDVVYEDSTYLDARTNQTHLALMAQIGNAAGGMVALSAPRCQVMDAQLKDADGLRYQSVTLQTRGDTEATDRSTALRRAAFRIHFA